MKPAKTPNPPKPYTRFELRAGRDVRFIAFLEDCYPELAEEAERYTAQRKELRELLALNAEQGADLLRAVKRSWSSNEIRHAKVAASRAAYDARKHSKRKTLRT